MSTDPLYPSQVFFMTPDIVTTHDMKFLILLAGLIAIMLILERLLCAFVRLLYKVQKLGNHVVSMHWLHIYICYIIRA